LQKNTLAAANSRFQFVTIAKKKKKLKLKLSESALHLESKTTGRAPRQMLIKITIDILAIWFCTNY